MFECCDATGNFRVEEVVGDWSQEDLNQDNVMLLDAWTALYLWIGKFLCFFFSQNIHAIGRIAIKLLLRICVLLKSCACQIRN